MIFSKKLLPLPIILFGFLISNCSSSNTPTKLSTPRVQVVPTTTISTHNPDLTHLTTDCSEIVDTPPKDITFNGSLVISSTAGNSYILNLATNEKTILEGFPYGELVVSPDRRKIAYIDYENEKLFISDSDGKRLNAFDNFTGHYSLIQWLDNESLAINKATEEQPPFTDFSLVVHNTVKKVQKEFYIKDFSNSDGEYKWNYYGDVIPNSQLTRVIYSVYGEGYPVILWDTTSNKEIKRIYFSDSLTAPRWSLDGRFIISAPIQFNNYVNFTDNLPYQGGNELFLVSDEGQTTRLTYLATKYKDSNYMALSWSPTEEYIAFELQNNNEPDFGLSILNVNTGEIINSCIQDNWGWIYWSPDGKQIAFTVGSGFDALNIKSFVLDLEKNQAFKVADQAEVAGWVINK